MGGSSMEPMYRLSMVGLPAMPRAAPSEQATKWWTTSSLVHPRAGKTTRSGELILTSSPPTSTVVSLLTPGKLADAPTLVRCHRECQLEHVPLGGPIEGEISSHQLGEGQRDGQTQADAARRSPRPVGREEALE